ncbi:hypothetical protein [Pilimelia columellifera]|uniref:Uncharacterized protein n=1 Tax=Pilimelia columellifera subsp. columellifera TaxID=706583 RepID=A0ABP6AXI2_9ACTN
MWRTRLACAATAAATLVLPTPAPAAAAARADNVRVQIVDAPTTVTAGRAGAAITATAVRRGLFPLGCQRVRWALSGDAVGVDVDDLRITREENGKRLDVDLRRRGDRIQAVDTEFDEGALCMGRNVTGTYVVGAVGGAAAGRVRFTMTALSAQGRILDSAAVTVGVRARQAPPTTPPPTGSPDPTPTDTPDPEPTDTGDIDDALPDGPEVSLPAPVGDATNATPASSSLPTLGFGAGALLLLVGLALLLNLYYRRQFGPGGVRGRHGRPPAAANMIMVVLGRLRERLGPWQERLGVAAGLPRPGARPGAGGPAGAGADALAALPSQVTDALAAAGDWITRTADQLNGRLVRRPRRH